MLLLGSHVKIDFVDPTNHQIVGFYAIMRYCTWDRKSNYSNLSTFIRLYIMRRLNQNSYFRRIIRHVLLDRIIRHVLFDHIAL